MALPLLRKRFTIHDFHRMLDAGILEEDDRVELIEGEVIEMAPIRMAHAMCVARLTEALAEQIRRRAIIWPQNSIILSGGTEVQPDVALLRVREYSVEELAPGPDDVLLVIEVADTTLSKDRKVKAPLYARAGINEYWLVNLPKRIVEVYSNPQDGVYQQVRQLRRGETLVVPAFSDASISVDTILP